MKNQIPVWAIIAAVVAVLALVAFFGIRALGPNSSGGRNVADTEAQGRMKQQMDNMRKDMTGGGARPSGGYAGQGGGYGGYGRPGGYGGYGRPSGQGGSYGGR